MQRSPTHDHDELGATREGVESRTYDIGGFPSCLLLGHFSLSLDTFELLGGFLFPSLDLPL